MSIQSVGVIGAGTMGNGIAQVCAVAGLNVVMVDINDAAVERGLSQISKSLDRLVKKETLTPEAKEAALKKIKGSTSKGGMTKLFASHGIAEVNFNDGSFEHGHGIPNGVRVMGEGGRVEDNRGFGIGSLVQPGNYFDF